MPVEHRGLSCGRRGARKTSWRNRAGSSRVLRRNLPGNGGGGGSMWEGLEVYSGSWGGGKKQGCGGR